MSKSIYVVYDPQSQKFLRKERFSAPDYYSAKHFASIGHAKAQITRGVNRARRWGLVDHDYEAIFKGAKIVELRLAVHLIYDYEAKI